MRYVSDVWQPLRRLFRGGVGFSERRLLPITAQPSVRDTPLQGRAALRTEASHSKVTYMPCPVRAAASAQSSPDLHRAPTDLTTRLPHVAC